MSRKCFFYEAKENTVLYVPNVPQVEHDFKSRSNHGKTRKNLKQMSNKTVYCKVKLKHFNHS